MKYRLRRLLIAGAFAGACAASLAGIGNGVPKCPRSQDALPIAPEDPESGVENRHPGKRLPDDPPCVPLGKLEIRPGTETQDICYATPDSEPMGYHWHEVSDGGARLYLSFDYWRPTTEAQDPKRPLIVYFHPNGVKSHLVAPKVMWQQIVQPAMARGWAVATVEFRHPVVDAYLMDPPHDLGYLPSDDAGHAMQYLRAHADKLGFDPDRLFALGYSRGSIALWQALQPDLASRDYPFSSRPRAFYGYQVPTTYSCDEYGQDFITDDHNGHDDRAAFIARCKQQNPHWRKFGSALQSVTRETALPVMLRYADPFWVDERGAVKLNTWWAIKHYNKPLYPNEPDQWDDTDHYPDLGRQLHETYLRVVGPHAPIATADCRNDQAAGFADWVGFVLRLLGE